MNWFLLTMFWPALAGSWLLTGVVRRYALRRDLLDRPNDRSSHVRPTPRGGGLAIVVLFSLATAILALLGSVSRRQFLAFTGGGLLIAAVGFWDDHRHLSAGVRFVAHCSAAAWAIACLGGAAPLPIGSLVWHWGLFGQIICAIGLVWMTNLYNFMDGIDGLAGLEALCASGLGGLLLAWSGLGGLAAAALALAGASAGFLVWNWPPAKIFMGDVGGGYLGFVFGVLAISSAKGRPWLLWPWLILLSIFIVDSVVTLIRRLIAGARWYEAHCSHAYQHAARRWCSHSKVTLTIAAINVAWLFPLAWGACAWPAAGPVFAIVALAPLVYMAFRYEAGLDTPAQL